MTVLPSELWGAIVKHDTEHPTLLALCLVCRQLRVEVQQVLFRRVANLPLRSQTVFFEAITDSPRLASYVRTFSIQTGIRMPPSYWGCLKAALRAMINLTELLFSRYQGEPCAADLLAGVCFQLKILLWGCISDNGLLPFLATQHELTDLTTYWGESNPCLARTLVPDLNDVGGNLATIRLFLPGRRVRHVHLTMFAPEKDLKLSDPLLEAFSTVSTFQISGSSPRPLLKDFGSALRNVKVLKIEGFTHLDHLEAQVALMPKLRRIVLSAGGNELDFHHHEPGFMQAEYVEALKNWLFEHCEVLESVDQRNIRFSDKYLQWTRLDSQAVIGDGAVRGW